MEFPRLSGCVISFRGKDPIFLRDGKSVFEMRNVVGHPYAVTHIPHAPYGTFPNCYSILTGQDGGYITANTYDEENGSSAEPVKSRPFKESIFTIDVCLGGENDECLVVAGSEDTRVGLFKFNVNTSDITLIKLFSHHRRYVYGVSFLPESDHCFSSSNRFASTSHDHSFRIYDIEKATSIQQLSLGHSLNRFAYDPVKKVSFITAKGGNVVMVDMREPKSYTKTKINVSGKSLWGVLYFQKTKTFVVTEHDYDQHSQMIFSCDPRKLDKPVNSTTQKTGAIYHLEKMGKSSFLSCSGNSNIYQYDIFSLKVENVISIEAYCANYVPLGSEVGELESVLMDRKERVDYLHENIEALSSHVLIISNLEYSIPKFLL